MDDEKNPGLTPEEWAEAMMRFDRALASMPTFHKFPPLTLEEMETRIAKYFVLKGVSDER